jgi:triacylglycerol lipase
VHGIWRIALGFALLVVLFNTIVYAWRAVILRQTAACDAVERLGIVNALWAFAKECAALAAVILLVPIGWLLPRCRAGAGSRGPLILVHGWGLNRGALWWLQRRLRRDGWSPVCCYDYRSYRADIERAAEQLRGVVEQVVTTFPTGQPVTLIGHSLGGLVLRYYVRRYPAANIRRIVTLGTPHFGSALAARGCGPAARKLAPGSPFLQTLNAADRIPKQFDVIAIYSTFDALALPPANAQYPGAFNIQVNDVGHTALLFSAKVYQLLLENLAAPLA